MAEEIKYIPISDEKVSSLLSEASSAAAQSSSLSQQLAQRPVTSEPARTPKNIAYVRLGDDADSPMVRIDADAPPEEIQELLKNPELEKKLFEQGYIYKYGVGAERYNRPDDLNDTAFMKGLKGGWTGLKTIGAGALGTVFDLLGAEDLEKATNDAIQRYQLEGQAKQYIKTDDGEVIPFSTSVEEIFNSDARTKDFLKWLSFNVGQGLVTTIPIFAASLVNPVIGVGAAYGMGVGDSRIAQLEATDFEKANAGLSLAAGIPYAAAERFFGAGMRLADLLNPAKEGAKEAFEKVLKESTAKTIAKATGKSMLGEAVAEGSQTVITETAGEIEGLADKNQSITAGLADLYTDKNFYKKIGEAAAAGAAGGGPFGIAGGVAQRININEAGKVDLKDSKEYTDQRPTDENNKDLVNKLGEDFKTKKYTVTGVGESIGLDGNPILDENENTISPTFQVTGIYDDKGKRKVILKDTTPGAARTYLHYDASILDSLNPIEDVKTDKPDTPVLQVGEIYTDNKGARFEVLEILDPNPKLGITNKSIRFKELDNPDREAGTLNYDSWVNNVKTGSFQRTSEKPVFDKPGDYDKVNVKPATAKQKEKAKSILKSRGYTDDAIDRIDSAGNRALLLEANSEDAQNYMSPEETERLGQLGYLEEMANGFTVEVPRGGKRSIYTAQKINEILNNTSINKKTGKSVGREILEDILENNVENTTTPVGKEVVGRTPAVPPLSEQEIVNQSDEKIAKQLSKIGDQLRDPKTSESKRQEIFNYRNILDVASTTEMYRPAIDRRYEMESLATRIGFGGTPAAIIGYQKAIEGLRKRVGITEEDRAEQIKQFQDRIDSAEEDLRRFNIIYSSFGYPPLTREQLNSTKHNSFPKRNEIRQMYQGKPEGNLTQVREVWEATDDSQVIKAREKQTIINDNKIKARLNQTFLGTISNTFWNMNGGYPGNKPSANADLAVVYMMPKSFTKLALKEPDLTMARQLQRQIAYAREGTNGITPPYLELTVEQDENNNYTVIVNGHEGRGRANWANSLNPNKPIPVLIKVNQKGKRYKNLTLAKGDSYKEVRDKVFRNPRTIYQNEALTKIDSLPEDQQVEYNPKAYTSKEVPIVGFIHDTDNKFGPIFKDNYEYNPFAIDIQMAQLAPRYTQEFTKNMPRVYTTLRNELDRLGLTYVNLSIVNRWLDGARAKGKFISHQDIATQALNFQKPQLISVLNSPKGEYGGVVTTADSQLMTLRHEAMHAMFSSGFFTDQEMKILKDYSKKVWVDKYNIKNVYSGQPNASEELYIEEGITFAFADYLANKYAAKGILAQAFERLKAYLIALGNALRGLGFTTAEDIFNDIDAGMFKQRVEEYKRLERNNIIMNNSILAKQYGKATFDTQIVNAFGSLSDAPITQPNYKNSLEYIEEPSSPDLDAYIPGTRQTIRKEMREMSNDIKAQEREEARGQISEKGLGTLSRVFSHARIWAKKYPIFEKLYTAVHFRDQKTRELQSKFVDILGKSYLKVIRNPQATALLNKAFEISQQVPGRYRRDENNRIIFRADRDGDGANSKVKAGDVVILEGDLADAYENAQEGIQYMHKEIVRGLLANDASTELLNDAIALAIQYEALNLTDKTFINGTKAITELTEADFENLNYTDINQITTAIANLQETIQDNPEFLINRGITTEEGKVLVSKIAQVLGARDSGDTVGTGMLALSSELKKYNDFTLTDYVPLQRFGNYFIVVKDKDNNTVDYRLFERGYFGGRLSNEESEVRAELEVKYGNNTDYTISETREVSIQQLRDRVQADFASIDSAASFISDTNKELYNQIRKEIETVLNKGTDLTKGQVLGFSAFIKPRKKEGGIPGYSTDFARAITQYGLASSNFAAGNRFNHTIGKAWRNTQDEKQNPDKNLRQASNEWYQYVLDPKQELASIRRLGFWYYLGGNISSAFLQLMSIVQFSGPILSTISGKRQSAAIELSKAFKDVMKMLQFNGRRYQDVYIDFNKLPEDVREDAMADVFNGTIKQGMAMHEAGMPQGGGIVGRNERVKRNIRTFENTVIGGVFNTFETIARLTAYIATHRMMQQTDAMENATKFFKTDADFQSNMDRNNGVATPRMVAQQLLEETFGVYGKLNRPKYMRGWGSVFFLFQTYISQMYSLMFRMFKDRGPAGKKALAKMMLMIALTGGLLGLPGMDEVAWLRDLIRKQVTGIDKDTRAELRNMLVEVSNSKVAEFFENGIFNALANVDVQRRLSFGNVPGSAQMRAILGMMGINTGARAEEFLGAPGAILFQNARNFFGAYNRTGDFPIQEFLYAVTPTFITNLIKAGDVALDGRVESRYGTVLTDDAGLYDAFLQGIGFTPTKVSKERELLRLEKLNVGRNSLIQSRMNVKVTAAYKKIYSGMMQEDFNLQLEGQEDLREILQMLFAHNSKQDLAGQLNIDVPSLASEALKDLIKEYRLLKQGSKVIPLNVKNAKDLGVMYDIP